MLIFQCLQENQPTSTESTKLPESPQHVRAFFFFWSSFICITNYYLDILVLFIISAPLASVLSVPFHPLLKHPLKSTSTPPSLVLVSKSCARISSVVVLSSLDPVKKVFRGSKLKLTSRTSNPVCSFRYMNESVLAPRATTCSRV
jgi:hypothetical protein